MQHHLLSEKNIKISKYQGSKNFLQPNQILIFFLLLWNLSKQNFPVTSFSVLNRQVFGLFIEVKYTKFPTLGLDLKFHLNRILFYSEFMLHRFHCVLQKIWNSFWCHWQHIQTSYVISTPIKVTANYWNVSNFCSVSY